MDSQNTPFSSNVKQPGLGVVFVLLLVGAMVGFQLGRWSNDYDRSVLISPTIKPCTEEAKVCPDGSSVGRIGPNCEFAECPYFIPSPSPVATDSAKSGCVKAGCSSQLCVPISQSDIVTTCEYKDEYDCLQFSRCEMQQNGVCGWTQTPEYSRCLTDLKK